MHQSERIVRELAASQAGVFSRRQALELGMTGDVIRNRCRSEQFIALGRGVYAYPTHPDSHLRRLWIEHLAAGPDSVVSHESAARLHGVSEIEEFRTSLIVGRTSRHVVPQRTWHRLDDLIPSDIVRFGGLPVTSPARTAVDLAAVVRLKRLDRAIESMVLNRVTRLEDIGVVLHRIRRRGKPGVLALETVLDRLGPGPMVIQSELEDLLDLAIRLTALPSPIREYPLPSTRNMTGFVDRCFVDAMLIVEADGRTYHQRRRDMEIDRLRDIEAARCGYLTLRLMHEHLKTDAAGMAEAILDVYRQRLLLLLGRPA